MTTPPDHPSAPPPAGGPGGPVPLPPPPFGATPYGTPPPYGATAYGPPPQRRRPRWVVPVVVAVAAVVLLGGAAAVWALLAGAEESVVDLRAGDCFDEPAGSADDGEPAEVAAVDTVDCAQPHDYEVYRVTDLPDGPYPGDEEVLAAGERICLKAFEEFVGAAYEDSPYEFDLLWPTEDGWAAGDRGVTCVAFGQERLTGSLAGSGTG